MDYKQLQEIARKFDLPIMVEDENGDPVIISKGRNNEIILETAQDNGWMRINTYYPDGVITETFDK